jgi:hypothetical protein
MAGEDFVGKSRTEEINDDGCVILLRTVILGILDSGQQKSRRSTLVNESSGQTRSNQESDSTESLVTQKRVGGQSPISIRVSFA